MTSRPTSTARSSRWPSDAGVTDFDFLPGRWEIHNRRLVDLLDPACDEWEEFEATSDAEAMLGGYGNLDHFHTAGYEGFSLRLY